VAGVRLCALFRISSPATCTVAFSQRLPAAIRDVRTEPEWAEFSRVLLGEGICAGLSVPVELDGGVIGTLDIYAAEPRDWDPNEVAALQAYGGLVAGLLSVASTAQVKGRLADQLQAVDSAAGRCGSGGDRRPAPASRPTQAGQGTRRAGQGSGDRLLTGTRADGGCLQPTRFARVGAGQTLVAC
jgi:GAF domain